MWALVPVKEMVDAKQRLASVLSPEERRGFFHAMLTDVLRALAGVATLDGIALITGDAEACALAAEFGADIIMERENGGQTAAVSHAVSRLMARGVEGIVQIPGDVPLARHDEIERVIAAHLPPPAMTIVPARDRRGSNCVACSPPDSVALRFGDNSFFPHLEAARRAGVSPTILELPGLALDIDTPADLKALLARPGDTLSYAYLRRSGIASRFQKDPIEAGMTAAAPA